MHFPHASRIAKSAFCAALGGLLLACGGGSDILSSATMSTSGTTLVAERFDFIEADSSGSELRELRFDAVPYGQNAADYRLSFAEEFDSFDAARWNDHRWNEDADSTENYMVADGLLRIWPQRNAKGEFASRTLDTDGKFVQTYGYFEIEARLPKGKGTWPAFRLFNHLGERRPEIDVMEAYAGGAVPWGVRDHEGIARPTAYAPAVWKGDTRGQLVGTVRHTTPDLSAAFHKYALKWEPNRLTFYFDGQEVLTVNATMSDPMYLMLDLAFGSVSGDPDDSTPEGEDNAFEIKYVRAWNFR